MKICSRFVVLSAMLAALTASDMLAPRPVAAQDNPIVTSFRLAPRTLRQHRVRATKAIEEGQFGEAVAELGALLAEEATDDVLFADTIQDFFVGPFEKSAVQMSLKTEAQRLLGEMPEAARELYELQFGADAKALLEEAAREGDLSRLTEVARKYYHTKAGYEATFLLGRLQLDRGEPLAAAMCFRRLAQTPTASRRFDPELSMLLATCWLYSGRREQAREVLTELRLRFPNPAVLGSLQIDGQKISDLPLPSEAEAWLHERLGGGRFGQPRGAEQWVMFRGDPARNAVSDGDVPLPRFRWHVPTASDPTDESLIKELRNDKAEQRIPVLPVLHSLAVDDVVLMRTPERLLAIDFETGKRVWEYPWWDASYDDVPLSNRPSSGTDELSIRREKLFQRLWQDTPYGQVSSDGKSVFMLDKLRYATQLAGNFLPRRGGLRLRNPDWPERHNELVALDLKREGSLRWMIGGESGRDEPKLAGAFFLGAPLALAGELYVIAELNAEIRLIALNADTGKQEWSQQLAHVDVYTIDQDPTRRLAGASPSYADGVLLCPTGAGAVVAVDVATRSLLWGYQYQTPKRPTRFGLARPYTGRTDPAAGRWIDSTITIADGAALVTPVESNQLICFDLDLADGEPRWELTRQGDLADSLFVAGIYRGKAIIVAKHKVIAINMKDKGLAWEKPVELERGQGEMPSGRGFQSGRYYFLPTTTSNLLKIDLDEGKLAARLHTAEPLGNLICYQDEVIAHSATAVSTFYQIEPLRKRVAERLEKTPDDPWALARHGELLLHDGKGAEALVSLQKAHQLDPEDDAVRSLLVTTFLTALKQDFAANQALSEQVEPLIELPAQRAEYWQAMAKGFHDARDFDRAVEAYVELTESPSGSLLDQGLSEPLMVKQSGTWSVRLDRWIHARLEQLYAEGGPDIQQRLDELVRARAAAEANRPLVQRLRDVDHFGFHPQSNAIRLACADGLIKAGRFLEAEQLLAALHRHPEPKLSGAASARLALLYSRANEFAAAARIYGELGDRWADIECYEGKTGRQLLAEAKESPALQTDFNTDRRWPWGHVRVEQKNAQSGSQSLSRLISLPVVSSDGRGHAMFGFDTRFNSVIARSDDGRPLLQIPIERVQQNGLDRVQLSGHLGVVYFGADLIAIDMLKSTVSRNESIRWRFEISPRVQSWQRENPTPNPFAPATSRLRGNLDTSGRAVSSMGPVNRRGVFYQRMRMLICADPMTGRPIWSQNDVEQGSSVFGDQDHIFVLPPNIDVATVFRAADGAPLGKRQLPAAANRWTTVGHHVLAWEDEGNRFRLFLRDIWEQTDVWSHHFNSDAKGTLTNDGHIAMLKTNGQFIMRSLQNDDVVIKARLEPDDGLRGLRIIRSDDQYLLFAETHLPAEESSTRRVATGNQLNTPIVNARVYAFDRETGRSLWQTPAVIEEHGLPLNQPSSSPALWFVRTIATQRTRLSPQNTNRASVLCIDRRTGRMLLNKDDIATQANEYNVVVKHEDAKSILVLPGHSFAVTFTDEPTPPAPPAQTGSASSLPDDNVLADMAGNLFKALDPQTKQKSDDPFEEGKPE
jgi:outer membrane protein assembly factor BamB/tetratricopeptide (TPR) repeat protein